MQPPLRPRGPWLGLRETAARAADPNCVHDISGAAAPAGSGGYGWSGLRLRRCRRFAQQSLRRLHRRPPRHRVLRGRAGHPAPPLPPLHPGRTLQRQCRHRPAGAGPLLRVPSECRSRRPSASPHPQPCSSAALQEAGVGADAAVHVGDHPDDDIRGAAQVGMATVWVNRSRHCPGTCRDREPTWEIVRPQATCRAVLIT
ncbi:MAG: HAD hydrolase-like protein [Gammaproteobacteria bacterium]|nr:HAD hydrolase-like protein [Gammaproteobacteria bacterium]